MSDNAYETEFQTAPDVVFSTLLNSLDAARLKQLTVDETNLTLECKTKFSIFSTSWTGQKVSLSCVAAPGGGTILRMFATGGKSSAASALNIDLGERSRTWRKVCGALSALQ